MLDQASSSPMLTFPRLPAWALIAGVIAPWSRVVMTALDLPRGKPRRQGTGPPGSTDTLPQAEGHRWTLGNHARCTRGAGPRRWCS